MSHQEQNRESNASGERGFVLRRKRNPRTEERIHCTAETLRGAVPLDGAVLLTLGVLFSFAAALIFGWTAVLHGTLNRRTAQGLIGVGATLTGLYAVTLCALLFRALTQYAP